MPFVSASPFAKCHLLQSRLWDGASGLDVRDFCLTKKSDQEFVERAVDKKLGFDDVTDSTGLVKAQPKGALSDFASDAGMSMAQGNVDTGKFVGRGVTVAGLARQRGLENVGGGLKSAGGSVGAGLKNVGEKHERGMASLAVAVPFSGCLHAAAYFFTNTL